MLNMQISVNKTGTRHERVNFQSKKKRNMSTVVTAPTNISILRSVKDMTRPGIAK
ncbi:hypothetical protein PITCH_A350037 [uncultured Desulfobacterium sp.]|uniref:Uncharacterized protein n=1 Tax=uncultured Desulfobacterium sp. TaxID=201089 RepID=A0A445MZB2_9BACT|nr:hypothetical protein PITCH_A350037 [uncultured Desulfobacterium sp.]